MKIVEKHRMKKCRYMYFAIFSDLFRRTFLMQSNNYTSTPKSVHFKHKKIHMFVTIFINIFIINDMTKWLFLR